MSGNVSLYNETKNEDGTGRAILPTPAIGGVGLLQDWRKSATIGFKAEEQAVWLVGGQPVHSTISVLLESGSPGISFAEGNNGHLGQSLWLREIHQREDGPPPCVDLAAERRNGEFIRAEITAGHVSACHDVSDGGVAVAFAEMALAGGMGATLIFDDPDSYTRAAFGEDQGRYVVATADPEFHQRALAAGIVCEHIGTTGGADLVFDMRGASNLSRSIPLADLRRAHESFLPALMDGEISVA